jgi:hypothetical protein
VQRKISSGVVMPSRILAMPAMRRLCTPLRIISALISAADAPCSTSSLSGSMNGITS